MDLVVPARGIRRVDQFAIWMRERILQDEKSEESKNCVMELRSPPSLPSNTIVGNKMSVEASFTQSTAPQLSSPKITQTLLDMVRRSFLTYWDCGWWRTSRNKAQHATSTQPLHRNKCKRIVSLLCQLMPCKWRRRSYSSPSSNVCTKSNS